MSTTPKKHPKTKRNRRPAILATSVAAVLALSLVPQTVRGQIWVSSTSSDWNTATNWNPATVPNGPGTTATFNGSSTTSVSLSAVTQVDAITFTSNASSPYTITVDPGVTFSITGAGITNGSGVTQNFVTAANGSEGGIGFSNSATAGSMTSFVNDGGTSSAYGGFMLFNGSSTAGQATITSNAGATSGTYGGYTYFTDTSSAGASTLIANGGSNGSHGGGIYFASQADGGTASVTANGNGFFDISGLGGGTPSGMNVGSIQGSGNVFLGGNTLAVGGNNLNTAFSGVIQAGGYYGGSGGALTKTGTGTLTLSGPNAYTGATTILSGTLQTGAANTIPSTSSVVLNIGGTLALNGFSQNIESIADGASGGGNISLGSATLTTGSANTTNSFSGVISGVGGGLTKVGTGTLTLSGANTYTGATTVNGGVLLIDTATNATVLNSASALVLSGATFQLNGQAGNAITQSVHGLTINKGTSEIMVNNLGTTTTLTLGSITRNAGGFVDFDATGGSLGTTPGNTIITTTQANDATGILGTWATVNGGTGFAARNSLGDIVAYSGYTGLNALGPNTVPNNATANVLINALGTSGPVPISATATYINTLTQGFTTDSTIDTSSGALHLGVTGGLFIAPGSASLTVGTAPGSGILSAGGKTVNTAGDLIFENNSNNLLTVNSKVTNNGAGVVTVTVAGSDTTVFAGPNTYTGATTISSGTLQLAATAAIPATSPVVVNSGGTLNLNNFSQNIVSIADGQSGGGTISLGAAALTTGSTNTSSAFSGLIQDGGSGSGGSLVKTGTGTLFISDPANTYTGGTTLASGTLVANGSLVNGTGTPLGTGTLTIKGGTLATTLLPTNTGTGTVLSNPISVLGNFSIATNSDPSNPGAQDFTLNGRVNLNGVTRTITGVTDQGQPQFSAGIGTVGETAGVNFNTTVTKPGDYVAFIFTSGAVNNYTGLTTVNNGAILVLEGSTPGGAFKGNLDIEGNGVIDYLGLPSQGAASAQIDNPNAIVTVNSKGTTLGTTVFGGLDLFNSTGDTIGTLNGKGLIVLASAALQVGAGSFSGTIIDGTHVSQVTNQPLIGGQLAKINAGTLLLSGANTYTGPTTVTSGTLEAGAIGTIPIRSTVVVSSGATFDLNGFKQSIGSLADATVGGGTVSLGSASLTTGYDNSTTVFSGVIQDGGISKGKGGSLVKVGTGTFTLGGTNTYTGTTSVNAGTLEVDGSLAAASTVNVATAGTLTGSGTINGKATLTGNGTIDLGSTGSILGTLAVTGGHWTGLGTVGGLVTSSTGTFNIATGASLTANTGLTVTGGTLTGPGSIKGHLTYSSSVITAFGGVVADGPTAGSGSLTLNNAATTLTLTGSNTYTGATTVSAGTLQIGNGTSGSLSGTGTVTVNGTGSLALDLASGTTFANPVVLNGLGTALKTINPLGTTQTLSGIIGGTGSFNQNGTGTTILNATESYTGLTNVNAGTLEVDGSLAAGSTVHVGTNGTLTGTGHINGNATLTGNGTINFSSTNPGTISGTLGITGGNWTGIGTVNGLVTSSLGNFNLNGTLYAPTGLAVTGGTFNGGILNGSLIYSSVSSTYNGQINGATSTVTVNNASSTLTLTGANGYQGATTIKAGTLQVGNGNSGNLNNSSGVTVSGTGTLVLDMPAGRNFNQSVNLNGPGTTLKIIQSASNSLTNVISGTGVLDQNGTGTTTLSQAETYTGATNVNAGNLQVNDSLAAGSTVNVGTAGILTGSGTINGKATLTGNGSIFLGSSGGIIGTLAITGGYWSGAGNVDGLVTSSANTFNLTGSLSALSGLNVTGGTLAGIGTLTGNLNYTSSASSTFSGVITGNSAVTMNKASTLTLTGKNTYTGTTTISAGTLQLGDGTTTGATLGAGSITVSGTGVLATNLADTETFSPSVSLSTTGATLKAIQAHTNTLSGVISGAGGLTQAGTGTTILTTTETYTGPTTVTAGTLQVDGALAAASIVNVSGTGTLAGIGTIPGTVNVLAGGTLSPGDPSGPGTITVGKLVLNAGSNSNFRLAAPGTTGGGVNDLVSVTGNLTVAGNLNVTALTGFGIGSYTLYTYGGTLTNTGFATINGIGGFNTAISIGTAHEVDLVVSATASQYWDGTGATNNGIISGGNGTWNNSTNNWTTADGTANSAWQGGTAVFAAPGGTVMLGATVNVQGLIFGTTGYTLSGTSALNLVGATGAAPLSPTISVTNAGTSATISAPITGNAGLTSSGAGTLILSNAANAYTGGTNITNGIVQIGTTAASGSVGSGTISVASGGTLTLVNAHNNLLANNITNGVATTGTLVINSTLANTLSGALTDGATGTLALTQSGTGTTILSNAGNNFSGATTISKGILQIGTATVAGSLGSNTTVSVGAASTLSLVNVAGNLLANNISDGASGSGLVSINSTNNFTLSGALSNGTGTLALTKNGTGTATVTGNNTYTGATTISAGVLQVGDGSTTGTSLGSSIVTTATAGTLTTDLAGGSFSNSVTDNGHVIATGTANNYTVSSSISGTGNFTKTGANTVTVTGANTYKGGTVVSGGSLVVNNATGSGTGSGAVAVNAGGTLGGSGTVSGATTLNSGGVIAPGAGSPGTAGTTLHAFTLTWNGGSTMSFQLGASTGDELALSGALTKGSAGAYTINITDAGIAQSTYTLLTFASTSFAQANFTLELPANYTGQLVETSTSLMLENLTASTPSSDSVEGAMLSFEGSSTPPAPGSADQSAFTVASTPEPGSATLLAFGGAALLGWRRRRSNATGSVRQAIVK